MSEREPTSASFEPERLGAKRRRIDPLVIVSSIVAVGLIAAVMKPWGGEEAISASPSASVDRTAASPAPSSATSDADSAGPDISRVSWPEVVAITKPHDAWGARVIVRPRTDTPDDPDLEELWAPAEPTVTGWSQVQLPSTDKIVVALGITHPADELPLDARVWSYGPDRAWHWLDTQRLDPSPWGGALQFTPPIVAGVQWPAWTAGRYRIEVLVDGGIRRIDVAVREYISVILEPGYGIDQAPARGAFSADVTGIGEGPFLTIDGDAFPFEAATADPDTSPAAAWLATARAPVTVLREPRASGLGVIMPVGATDIEATIRSLGPESLSATPKQVVRTRIDDGPRTPYVVFGSPGGGAWPAGTYAIDTSWSMADGHSTATYLVEFAPQAAMEPLALAAARTFLDATAGVEPTLAGVAVPATELSCAREMPSVDQAAFIGVSYPPGRPPSMIRLQLEATPGRFQDQPILVARDVAPGMSMIGPADRAAFSRGNYRLTTGDGPSTAPMRLCLGTVGSAY
jgi:hypothetical protein